MKHALVLALGLTACGGSTLTTADMVGTWTGTEQGNAASGSWTFVFTTSEMTVKAGDTEAYKGTYTLDASADPVTFTAAVTDSAFAAYVGKTVYGLVKIEGGAMTFAGNEPGNTAKPTSFVPGGGTRVFNLTRQ